MEEHKMESLFSGVIDHHIDRFDDHYNEILIDFLTCLKPSCPELEAWVDFELSTSFGG